MNYYFGPHIKEEGIRMNPPSNINSKWRYSLEIPFKDSVWACCICNIEKSKPGWNY
ncbi:hypothetical protein BACERE00195_00569 [Bacillus cereus]|nr:hypothetical protein BACERE00195_00569 [Bacillus cereus]